MKTKSENQSQEFTAGEDEQIMLAYMKVDASRIEVLIRKYTDQLLKRCYKYFVTKPPYNSSVARTAAEEAVQDAWLKVIDAAKKGHYKAQSPFGAWINTVAQNACKDILSRKIREGVFVSSENELTRLGEEETEDPLTESAPNGYASEPVMPDDDVRTVLRHCVDELEHKYRQIISMFLADKTQRDMAKKLDIGLGTAFNYLKEAYQKIKTCLNKAGWSDNDVFKSLEAAKAKSPFDVVYGKARRQVE
ncbi:MAG: sigma-70 family RNA polymerase sigma factor [Deltaproteobacteria bacterium]|nr:sigma-70 family RNA polymerase sigma factor [Deltaproteobacteria bacterium]